MEKRTLVTVISASCEARLEPLLSQLAKEGYCRRETAFCSRIPRLLQQVRADAVLVYQPPESDLARKVLQHLEKCSHRAPVIVIVDEGEFKEYYELMCLGAYDYFALTEGCEVIVNAIKWAGRAQPLSPLSAAFPSLPVAATA